MRKGWQRKRLGDLCAISTGGTPSKDQPRFWDGDVPFVSARDLKADRLESSFLRVSRLAITESATRLAPPGSLLMLVRGMGLANGIQVGEVVTPVAFNQDLRALLPPLDSVLPRFLLLSLRTSFAYGASERVLSSAAHGTLKIDGDALRGLEVWLPPLVEQKRIVGLLDEAFESLAAAKANAEKNLQNARVLFESRLEAIFSRSFDGPERRLDEVCGIVSALVDPQKPEFAKLTHVGAGNIQSKTGEFVDLRTAEEEGLISGKFPFDESMVLYSKIRPYLMKVGRPDFAGLCSADMYPLVPATGRVTRDFLFYLLLTKRFTDYAIEGSARAGMPKVNRDHLFAFQIRLPDVLLQEQLAKSLDALSEETRRLEQVYQQKLAALDALKKSLLHQAFSGAL